MLNIKFSHAYPKLYGEYKLLIRRAKLLQVSIVELSDMTAEFLAYDTAQGSFKLPPKGKYLMLLFLKPGSIHLFTTMRSYTPEKHEYYSRQVGEIFAVSITQNEPAQ